MGLATSCRSSGIGTTPQPVIPFRGHSLYCVCLPLHAVSRGSLPAPSLCKHVHAVFRARAQHFEPGLSQVVRCLLIVPSPDSALNEEAGKMFMEDFSAYCKKAQMMAEVHAMPAKPQGEASTAGAASAAGVADADGEPFEKRQKPVVSKAEEKRRQEKKKALKRL